MNTEENVHDELKGMAPGFPGRKTMDPPPGYFEKLPGKVLNRWRKEQSKSIPAKINLNRLIGIAAIITGLCLGGLWLLTTTSGEQLTAISAIEAYQYVHENIDEFESMIEVKDDEMIGEKINVPKDEIEEFLFEETGGSDPEELF